MTAQTVDRPPTTTPTPTVTYRLRNPWTPHLIGSCVLAAATTTGAFAGAVVNDTVRALPVGLVLAVWALVMVVHRVQDAWWQRAPKTAFKPVDNV